MAELPTEQAPEKRRGRLSWMGWLVILLLCAGMLGAAFYRFDPLRPSDAAMPAPAPISVVTGLVRHAEVQDELTFVASLTALRRITISPYTSGHVTDILVPDGARVRAGDPLYRLDDRTAQAELALAQGRVEINKAKVERDATLQREGFLARSSLGDASAGLAEAEIDLRVKQLALDLLTIRAPFDGRLERHLVAQGQYVTPGTAMIDLVDHGEVAADFQVPERQLARVRMGAAVSFDSHGLDGSFQGSVSFVSGVIDTATRSFAVRAILADPDHRLRPGLFGRLRLATGDPRDALVVPEAALIQQLTGAAIYQVIDRKAALTKVEIGTRGPAGVEISKGLAAGDEVVVSGQFRLRDGDLVQPRQAAGS